jgi:hypothetical protein
MPRRDPGQRSPSVVFRRSDTQVGRPLGDVLQPPGGTGPREAIDRAARRRRLARRAGGRRVAGPGRRRARRRPLHAVGDYGATSDTSAVLSGIAQQNPDLNLALGDLSYGGAASEQAWCDFVTQRVGAGFPFELLAGNHESSGQDGNINDSAACLTHQVPGVVGTYGRQWYVDVPKANPWCGS